MDTDVLYSTVHNRQAIETPLKPYNGRRDQKNVIYLHNGVLRNNDMWFEGRWM
jgi:hypothetical protein